MYQIILLIVLLISTIAGYKLIAAVPSMLHTPLMSGMNALSGVTVLGALTIAGTTIGLGAVVLEYLGYAAIILAMVNVVGGFAVTDRMLRMFKSEND